MTDAAPTASTAPAAEAPAAESKETPPATNPWGDNFDAETAWKALEASRAAEKAAKAEAATFKKAEQDKADAELSELEKLRKDFAALTAESTAHKRVAQLTELGLDKALHAFITAETPEAIAEQVTALKTAIGDKAPAADPKPDPAARPQPKLTPGHGGDDKAAFDADAIVKSIRG